MTNNQKNQIAAMNASGMSIDEIVLDTGIDKQTVTDFVAERNALNEADAKRKAKNERIDGSTRQAIIEWFQSGHTVKDCAKKFGKSEASVYRFIKEIKSTKKRTAATKERQSAMEETSMNDCAQHNHTTKTAECQAGLKGVEVIGLMQTMIIGIEENFGDNADIMSLKADSDEASIVFRWGGKAYAISFGQAF